MVGTLNCTAAVVCLHIVFGPALFGVGLCGVNRPPCEVPPSVTELLVHLPLAV